MLALLPVFSIVFLTSAVLGCSLFVFFLSFFSFFSCAWIKNGPDKLNGGRQHVECALAHTTHTHITHSADHYVLAEIYCVDGTLWNVRTSIDQPLWCTMPRRDMCFCFVFFRNSFSFLFLGRFLGNTQQVEVCLFSSLFYFFFGLKLKTCVNGYIIK